MLLPRETVLEMVRCPVSGARLLRTPDGLVPELPNGCCYRWVNGLPVLIDFDDSVCAASEVACSPVARSTRRGFLRWLKAVISPNPSITEHNMRALISLLRELGNRPIVLVVGGGTIGHGITALYEDQSVDVISFDIYASSNVHFIADAHKIPLPDASVDGVVIQAVLEHVLEPQRVVAEIHRVLRDDGVVYAETPFLQPVHEGPYDFTRFTESGHRYLFKQFELLSSGSVAGPGPMLLGAVDIVSRSLLRSRLAGKLVKIGLFWLKYLDNCISEPYRIDAASGVFFLGTKADRSISAKEAIAHYRGSQRH